jgi:hypothetical protein
MVTFEKGTNFPAVSWNFLLAIAMMNIRHHWNGIGVPTKSHRMPRLLNFPSETFKKGFWRVSSQFCSTFSTAAACKQEILPDAQDPKVLHKAVNSWISVWSLDLTKTVCHTIRYFYEVFLVFANGCKSYLS